jgi:hypothetical protein
MLRLLLFRYGLFLIISSLFSILSNLDQNLKLVIGAFYPKLHFLYILTLYLASKEFKDYLPEFS